ncbi:hypothetical protein A3759_12370 [Thalassolituus sp. HI0120]|nr:hypothetical protein A3759_12370 [Thalassolituus sp. HI0120]
MQARTFSKLALTAATAALVACGSDSDSQSGNKNISLEFAAQLNSSELKCGSNTETVGTAQTPADIKYFGAYISELEVATASGEFQKVTLSSAKNTDVERGISLITFCGNQDPSSEETTIYNQIQGTVAEAADYTRVRFTLGVPEQYNHLDATQTEGILAKSIFMHWNWTAGYKHIRMDVANWNIHLGSTNCTGENADARCNNGNRPRYTLENIDLNADQIVFDYAALVNNSNISSNTANTPPGCMSRIDDPECGEVFKSLGLDLTSGQCLNGDCNSQSWIRSEPK